MLLELFGIKLGTSEKWEMVGRREPSENQVPTASQGASLFWTTQAREADFEQSCNYAWALNKEIQESQNHPGKTVTHHHLCHGERVGWQEGWQG